MYEWTVKRCVWPTISISGCTPNHWKELFFELPVCAVLPILPLVFPLLWNSINLWGIARLETLLTLPQPVTKSNQEKPFEVDLDTPTFEWESTVLPSRDVFLNWIGLWQGNSYLLGRSANVVQVLGSITALCCVDKKGILSWPNPTAEKVFFLRDSSDKTSRKSQSSLESEVWSLLYIRTEWKYFLHIFHCQPDIEGGERWNDFRSIGFNPWSAQCVQAGIWWSRMEKPHKLIETTW